MKRHEYRSSLLYNFFYRLSVERVICFAILIDKQNFRFSDNHSSNIDSLFLTFGYWFSEETKICGKTVPFMFFFLTIWFGRFLFELNELFSIYDWNCIGQIASLNKLICGLPFFIIEDIFFESSIENDRFLSNNPETTPEITDFIILDVFVINQDFSFFRLLKPIQQVNNWFQVNIRGCKNRYLIVLFYFKVYFINVKT